MYLMLRGEKPFISASGIRRHRQPGHLVGTLVGEVQRGLCEDGDQIVQALDHCRALAKIVGISQVGKVAGCQLLVGAAWEKWAILALKGAPRQSMLHLL
ncbi:hypothetical protein [Achromobacter spanius]|uniref:hypothetical protein n=1 Tax=Achromobacter spanius TaxID=217203 RepID=UPI003207F054